MPKLHTTTYQVRVSADKFKSLRYHTTVCATWSQAKRIAKRCIEKHGLEAKILTVRSR